jgi:hypothetical protein
MRVKSSIVVDKYTQNILWSDLQVDLFFAPPHEVSHFVLLPQTVQIEQLPHLYPSTALVCSFLTIRGGVLLLLNLLLLMMLVVGLEVT